jgi:hypothetical protein
MRKSILSAATALVVVAAGIVSADRPAAAALSNVPADCSVSTAAYRPDGQRLTYVYSAGQTSIQSYPNDSLLTYVPKKGSSLYRSQEFEDGGTFLSVPVKLSDGGWDKVNTLIYERTRGTGTGTVDVLLGTTTDGELKEWRISRATPTKIDSLVLRSSGWASFTSLSTGYCDAHPNGRPILGITAAGAASVYFDARQADRDGTASRAVPSAPSAGPARPSASSDAARF